MARVLVIGGHGTLGRPVVRCLLADGFKVRLLARDPDKAWAVFPAEVEVVKGDVKDIPSITSAADGCDIVHINLATRNVKADFREELDGTHNIVEALKDRPSVTLSKLSAFGARPTSGHWLDEDQKFYAEHAIMASGHPWLIWRPTWFMESLPLFVRKKKMTLFIRDSAPLHWIAGHDYGLWVARAFADNSKRNRFFNVQGPEAIGFKGAARRFLKAYDPSIPLRHISLGMVKFAGVFSTPAKEFARLLEDTRDNPQPFRSETTWEELGKPTMKIEDYVEYMHTTGDVPGLKG